MKTYIRLPGGSKFEKLSLFVWQPDFPKPHCLFMQAQLFKEIKVFQTCHYTSFQSHSSAIVADVCPRTLDDGVIGHCLHTPAVIIKRQVPHPWVQVLDESSLVDSDRVLQPGPCLWFILNPMLFGDKPAAIQELHKVILQNNNRTDSSRCS